MVPPCNDFTLHRIVHFVCTNISISFWSRRSVCVLDCAVPTPLDFLPVRQIFQKISLFLARTPLKILIFKLEFSFWRKVYTWCVCENILGNFRFLNIFHSKVSVGAMWFKECIYLRHVSQLFPQSFLLFLSLSFPHGFCLYLAPPPPPPSK